jgi:hypothetical protein
MTYQYRGVFTFVAAVALSLPHALGAQTPAEPKKPTLAVRATPPVGFAPLRVRASADVRDGNDDHPDFYCATVEWDWGDGTISENTQDCDPYEPGKSTIRRRFTADHIYRQQGQFKLVFKLKQKTKQVAAVSTNVQVRGGVGDGFGR